MSSPSFPAANRYERMPYARCGRSGLKLPRVSLGLWHNFGGIDAWENGRAMCRRAFDLGITHFDLANNYGPPPGSAEENFGRILAADLRPWRDELIISTKAGYRMWDGPYGEWGSRKSLLASLDQSLRRMKLDYVDIFYSHRPDPETPLEETLGALADAVRSGKALYAGISNYPPEMTLRAASLLREMGTPCLINQLAYHLFHRVPEAGLFAAIEEAGMGCIVFSPLAQGMLTSKYLRDIPADSRAAKPAGFLKAEQITEARRKQIHALNGLAEARGQTLAQLALAWVQRQAAVTSVLIGASRVEQIDDCCGVLQNAGFTDSELAEIDRIAPAG